MDYKQLNTLKKNCLDSIDATYESLKEVERNLDIFKNNISLISMENRLKEPFKSQIISRADQISDLFEKIQQLLNSNTNK